MMLDSGHACIPSLGLIGRLTRGVLFGPKYHPVAVVPDGRAMTAIARLMREGRLKVVVDRTFSLDESAYAPTWCCAWQQQVFDMLPRPAACWQLCA